MFKRNLSLILGGLMLTLSLAACSANAEGAGTTNATSDPATTLSENAGAGQAGTDNTQPVDALSGSVTVYTALEDEQVEEYLQDFSAKYPDIQVNVVRESTGVITAKLIAENDNPQADLVWGTAASSLMVLETMGALEPYAPEGLDRILPQFKSDAETPTWVGIDAWETAIIINTEEAEKLDLPEVTSFQDLLDPAFEGLVVMSNPNSSGTGLLTVSGVLQMMGQDAGWSYLDSLDKNIAMYVHSGSKPAKMAAAGECVVGISFGYAGISQRQLGAPVEVVFPSEGSGWDLEANALIKKDEINPLAMVFLDWAICDDAMDMYKTNYPIITTGGNGTYEGYESDPTAQLIDNDFEWVANNREDILAEWIGRYDSKSEEK